MSNSSSFCRIQTLDPNGVKITFGRLIADQWAGMHIQNPIEVIDKFIKLNQRNLHNWLGVDLTSGINDRGEIYLHFIASEYIGCIPIYSPFTGLPTSTVEVYNRTYTQNEDENDIAELLDDLQDTISPEYNLDLPLPINCQLHPPIYLDCLNFIIYFAESIKKPWCKFSNRKRFERSPNSGTNWSEYAHRSTTNPSTHDIYSNKSSFLSSDHPDWRQLCYVLNFCINKITSIETPSFIRVRYNDIINRLSHYLQSHPITPVSELRLKKSEPINIQALKELANIILKNKNSRNYAWRMNSACFFERYVQFLVKKACLRIGGSVQCNTKFNISGSRPTWCLQYLEPDMLVQSGQIAIVIDAKYKSHMLNTFENSEKLKDIFRSDLHQVMAYSSLNGSTNKNAILVYPYAKKTEEDDDNHKHTKEYLITIHGWGTTTKIHLLGIPLKKRYQEESILKLSELFKHNTDNREG